MKFIYKLISPRSPRTEIEKKIVKMYKREKFQIKID